MQCSDNAAHSLTLGETLGKGCTLVPFGALRSSALCPRGSTHLPQGWHGAGKASLSGQISYWNPGSPWDRGVCAWGSGGEDEKPLLPSFPLWLCFPPSQLIPLLLGWDQQGGGPLAAVLLQCLFKGSVRNKDLPSGLGRQLLYVN